MSIGAVTIEQRRAADRKRVAEYLQSQKPIDRADWLAQIRVFESAGRDTASALPFWKRLWRRN
ncbi:hypothetical protein [Prosthecobacter sp.]|uniref:hypothetical protein n=1 Tax=Prosthecobacter sp. TaxID=1965333 RepID=UPI0025FE81A6|nr:hypothetical protein [Prosthecobacter sp.]